MTRTGYLLVLHASCLAMVVPAGVIVIALRLWLEQLIAWCSDRVSRRFVRRIVAPKEPVESPLAKEAKAKRALKVRAVARRLTRLPVGGEERGTRIISSFMG